MTTIYRPELTNFKILISIPSDEIMRILSFFWSIPVKIISSVAFPLNLEQPTAKMRRRRPLHTCAASCIAVAHKATTKIQDLDCPLGSTARKAATYFNSFFPFVYTMLHQWLALLSAIDDQILTVENRIETVLPKTTSLFDTIDALLSRAESLPENLEQAARKFPLLDWILLHLISCLNFLLSIFGSNNTKEKEITIDVNCKTASDPVSKLEKVEERNVIHLPVKRLQSWKSRIKALEEPLYAGDSPMYSSYYSANSSPVSDGESNPSGMSCSYKEMLERGTKLEEDDLKEEDHDIIALVDTN